MIPFFLTLRPGFTPCFLIRRSLRHMCWLTFPRRPRLNSNSLPAEFRVNSSQMWPEQRSVYADKRCVYIISIFLISVSAVWV